jgi:hypothetical protein
LAAGESAKGKKGKGKNKHANLTWYNCDKKGHISRFCKEPKKSKNADNSGKGKQKDGKGSGSGTANAVTLSKEEVEEGAWAVVEELDWFEQAMRR